MKKIVRRGFTLPEILVTVTVIAVLAAVVVPAVTQYVSKGDAPSTQQDLNELRSAITNYVADTRQYPTYWSDLTSPPANVSGWKGPYTSAAITGSTGQSTFSSTGLKIKLGALTASTSSGYLETLVNLTGNNTCSSLWAADKGIDNSDGLSTDADSLASTGALRWDTNCNVTTGTHDSEQPTGVITLRLMAIGK
jgi:type IV pilus assembly protein PilE